MINELNGVEVLNEEQEWQQQNNKNYYNWKKKFLDFRIFLKNTIIHVCRKKNYFRRSCNKTSKTFFKNRSKKSHFFKKYNFSAKIQMSFLLFLARKLKYLDLLIFTWKFKYFEMLTFCAKIQIFTENTIVARKSNKIRT